MIQNIAIKNIIFFLWDKNISQKILRENFKSKNYFLDDWQEVYFISRDKDFL